MENFDDFEKKSYRGVKNIEYKFTDHIVHLLSLIKFGFRIFVVLIKEIFENIFNPPPLKNLSGQLALVTGGANGLGRATAFRLAKENCNIVIVDINELEAEKTAKEIEEKFKVTAKAFKVDVSDFEAIEKLRDDINRDFGQSVDILVNNAGILSAISLTEGHYKQVQKVIDVNLTAHFWTTRVFLPQMIEKKRGHIVGIASLSGKITMPLAVAYCATKFGTDGFYRALTDELGVEDHDEYIHTTCVFPSFINTRKELTDILDQMDGVGPRMSPSYVANEIVEAVKRNKRSIVLPGISRLFMLANFLPSKTMKFTKTKFVPMKRRPEHKKYI